MLVFYHWDLSGPRATNVIKLSHDWQNDSHQKNLFYSTPTNTLCPAGFGELESHMHFLSYKEE